jgi:hypothetical protein
MYQNPPPPYAYPTGYGGYFPPPPGHRFTSATPSPRGSAQKTRHSRHASQQQVPPGYAYSPRGAPPQFQDPRFSSSTYHASPLRKPEFVSGFDYPRGQTRYRAPSYPDRPRSSKQSREDSRYREHCRYGSFHPSYNVYDVYDDEYDGRTPPPPYETYAKFAAADYRYYYQDRERARDQERSFEREPPTPKANQSRRRSSTFASDPRPPQRSQTAAPRPQAQASKRQANEADRLRMGIPAGYSLKNWDPTEEPIMVLGSVFDANSLGKWIYDWACYAFGSDKPLTDMAAELWLLLIHLAGKFKRADEVIERVRVDAKREMVEDFLESGERLWIRFRKLLKVCEDYMWKAAQRETGEKKPANMGPRSGVAFVKCLFGRDCELEKTEKLMANIRLFSVRFEVNIEPILRNPEAEESDDEKDTESESED